MSDYRLEQNLKGRFHEVAAIILIEKSPRAKEDVSVSPLDQLLGLQHKGSHVLLQRAWYSVDQSVFESDLLKQVKPVYDDRERILSLYEQLRVNVKQAPDMAEKRDHDYEEMIAQTIADDIEPVIRVELDADFSERAIKLSVPFVKLQKYLLRASAALERAATGAIREVTITHAPLFDRNKAHVGALFH